MEKRSSRRPPPRPPAKKASAADEGKVGTPAEQLAAAHARIATLEARLAALEAEVVAIKASTRSRRGPPPLPEASPTIDVSDVAELIEPTRRSRA